MKYAMVVTINGIDYRIKDVTSDVTADDAEEALGNLMETIANRDYMTFQTEDGRALAVGVKAILTNGVISFVPVESTEKQ